MKVLLIHADWMEYKALQKTKMAEEIREGMEGRMEEVLVVFTSVESGDYANLENLVSKAADEIGKVYNDVKAERILIYPYAHLSSDLAKGAEAVAVLDALSEKIAGMNIEVRRAPFGWYKEFNIKCKGHPLSELSKEIKGEEKEEVSKALVSEKKAVSRWYVIDTAGNLHELRIEEGEVKGYDFSRYQNLKKFAHYEMAKARAADREPPHVELMRRMELVDYEPGSDPGNFRYYPKGRLIKNLLEQYVSARVRETGGMEVETPIMYDFEHPSLKKYLHRFPARQYTIQTPDKKVFLRFAACFGQFLIMHNAKISYRHLPLRLYELTRYSFRVEQRGELAGLRRLRAFTMPDCHSFCADIEMAKRELLDRFELSREILSGIGFSIPEDLELALRVTKDFYEEHGEVVRELVRRWGKPALLEMWDERFFYFVFKYEWNFVDALDKASALNTDQIDVENAERYGITFTGEDGKDHFPLILHQSPSGAIERVIYALLEKEFMKQEKGKKSEFPLWLAPTQVRFIPVSEQFVGECITIAKQLGCRADVDDRDESVSKRIRDAEREWVSIIAVYGEKEKASGKLNLRMRNGETTVMTPDELGKYVREKIAGYPFITLPLPLLLSKRPIFRG
ncbi:MAG: threonine--tRNA ligase [Thermoplasmata archaeon]|nr:threonine--tRNA ligase [Thermoplasmata archaeon]